MALLLVGVLAQDPSKNLQIMEDYFIYIESFQTTLEVQMNARTLAQKNTDRCAGVTARLMPIPACSTLPLAGLIGVSKWCDTANANCSLKSARFSNPRR